MIYFDNSATTYYKPPTVVNAVVNALTFLSANPGRGGHSMAMKTARLVQHTREKVAGFFQLDDFSRALFTDNCSGALNLAILGSVKAGGHVITSAYEHNSVLRPLQKLMEGGLIDVTVLPPDGNGSLGADSIRRHLRKNTYLVITNHVSNVTGAVTDTAAIGALCREKELLYLVDAAQSAGYLTVDMAEQNIDLLAVAPHKGLHAPQGVGLLLVGKRAALFPIRYGGTGTVSHLLTQPVTYPEGFETGTLPAPAIAGLSAALCWTERHFHDHQRRIMELSMQLFEGLQQISGVTVYSPCRVHNGILSFNVSDFTSETVGDILSEQSDICVRAGLHCAPLIHRHYGTHNRGMVRASLGCDNTPDQIDFFLKTIRELAE